MKKIILASKSPRRHEILMMAGLDHQIKVSDADEALPNGICAADAAGIISRRKAEAVKDELAEKATDCVIIAADTVVEVNGEIYGKPRDRADAKRMLEALSGSVHLVHTGLTVIDGEKIYNETVTTEVTMREITEDEIEGYIESHEPDDKAGSYAIQGIGGAFVSSLKGDYFNVMGLPLCRTCTVLQECGIKLFG